jgi:hypothetical protein
LLTVLIEQTRDACGVGLGGYRRVLIGHG